MHDREQEATARRETRPTSAKHSSEVGDVMQGHSREHQVERLGRLSQVLDVAQDGFSRRVFKDELRSLDHPRRTVNASIAHSTRAAQLASDLGIAAPEVKHAQSRHRAELVEERRALHDDVRTQRPRTVLLISLEQLRVVVERAAAPDHRRLPPSNGILGVTLPACGRGIGQTRARARSSVRRSRRP